METTFNAVVGIILFLIAILSFCLVAINSGLRKLKEKYETIGNQVDKIVSRATTPKTDTLTDYYPGYQYQELFNHMSDEHGLTLIQSEMDEIIRHCGRFIARNERAAQKEPAKCPPPPASELTQEEQIKQITDKF